jgi:hypothetical protein
MNDDYDQPYDLSPHGWNGVYALPPTYISGINVDEDGTGYPDHWNAAITPNPAGAQGIIAHTHHMDPENLERWREEYRRRAKLVGQRRANQLFNVIPLWEFDWFGFPDQLSDAEGERAWLATLDPPDYKHLPVYCWVIQLVLRGKFLADAGDIFPHEEKGSADLVDLAEADSRVLQIFILSLEAGIQVHVMSTKYKTGREKALRLLKAQLKKTLLVSGDASDNEAQECDEECQDELVRQVRKEDQKRSDHKERRLQFKKALNEYLNNVRRLDAVGQERDIQITDL